MKQIPLSQGYVALVDDEDYEWLAWVTWTVRVRPGTSPYAYHNPSREDRRLGARPVHMHRLLLGLDPCDRRKGEHKNGNGIDNRRLNLRVATQSQNLVSKRNKPGISGLRGVYPDKGKWAVRVRIERRSKQIGTYNTREEAARAYNQAALAQWGEFAVLNKT